MSCQKTVVTTASADGHASVGRGNSLELIFLIWLSKPLAIEYRFEYNRRMQLGDQTTALREQRTAMEVALDTFDTAINGLISAVEFGGLDQLEAGEKVAVWQRFETLRNKLPLVD